MRESAEEYYLSINSISGPPEVNGHTLIEDVDPLMINSVFFLILLYFISIDMFIDLYDIRLHFSSSFIKANSIR
jgi:hypothetical protein